MPVFDKKHRHYGWRIGLAGLVAFAMVQAFRSSSTDESEASVNVAPDNKKALLIRTHFEDEQTWRMVRDLANTQPPELFEMIRRMSGVDDDPGSLAELKSRTSPCAVIDDQSHDTADLRELLAIASDEGNGVVFFVFDQMSAEHPEHPLLVVNPLASSNTFRALPGLAPGLQNSLVGTGGLSWDVFAEMVDQDGIYRGTPNQ